MNAASPLTRCPRCSTVIGYGNIVGATGIDDVWLSVGLICPLCHLGSHLKIARTDWERLMGAEPQGQQVSKESRPAEGAGSIDPREIGRMVKGFATVELSPSLTVDDLRAIWDYQERTDC